MVDRELTNNKKTKKRLYIYQRGGGGGGVCLCVRVRVVRQCTDCGLLVLTRCVKSLTHEITIENVWVKCCLLWRCVFSAEPYLSLASTQ